MHDSVDSVITIISAFYCFIMELEIDLSVNCMIQTIINAIFLHLFFTRLGQKHHRLMKAMKQNSNHISDWLGLFVGLVSWHLADAKEKTQTRFFTFQAFLLCCFCLYYELVLSDLLILHSFKEIFPNYQSLN